MRSISSSRVLSASTISFVDRTVAGVWRPIQLVSFVYCFLFWIPWVLFVQCTCRYAIIGEEFGPIFSTQTYVALSLLHLGLFVVLVLDTRRTWRGSLPELRKGHNGGAFLVTCLLVGTQWAAQLLNKLPIVLGP